jgi:hypothetical protein
MSTTEKALKPKRAIDYLPDDPFAALEKVWELEDVAHFIHYNTPHFRDQGAGLLS